MTISVVCSKENLFSLLREKIEQLQHAKEQGYMHSLKLENLGRSTTGSFVPISAQIEECTRMLNAVDGELCGEEMNVSVETLYWLKNTTAEK